jgi:two-component system sensor histidine kinase CpxA
MHSLDLYAKTSISAYEQGGAESLNDYLSGIRSDSQVSATLFKNNVNLTGVTIPAAASLLTRAREQQQSQFSFRSPWLGVIRQARGNSTYFFVAQVRPVRMFGNFVDPDGSLFRLALALLISISLCGLLAKSITRPIQSLQKTAMAIAGGDLTARASPMLRGRADEIASLARDFDRMADRIQALLDQQKLLLRDISHELRSPLARLSISAELVQRGDLTAAERMQSDIKSLEKMISDLLTLARIDASDKYSRLDKVHVGRLVQQIVKDASFEGIRDNKSVVQTGSFEHYVFADTGLLHSCIENVVRNALRHTPHGGVVEVHIDGDSGIGIPAVSISITDEGIGVPEQALEQIFDPFFRVPSPEAHKQGGAGLGLSISKRIATLYGGSIAAQNLPDSGLQVQIRFPAAKNG